MTIIKNIALIILLFIYSISFGKAKIISNCVLLTEFLNEKTVWKHLNLDTSSNSSLYIIDTSNFFTNCYPTQSIYKEIPLSIDTIFDLEIRNLKDLDRLRNYILIPKIEKCKKIYRIYFFHKITNGYGFIEYKSTGDKLICNKYQFGQL